MSEPVLYRTSHHDCTTSRKSYLPINRFTHNNHEKKFHYFGGRGPRIPEEFADIVHSTQGHLRIRGDRDDSRYHSFLDFL